MDFATITKGMSVWFINRPPNLQSDLLEGTVVGLHDYAAGKGKTLAVIEVEGDDPTFSRRYKIEAVDVYGSESDAVDALEAEYNAEAAAKAADIASKRS